MNKVVATNGRPIVCHTVVMTAHHIIKNVNYLIMKSDGQKTVGLHFFFLKKNGTFLFVDFKKNECSETRLKIMIIRSNQQTTLKIFLMI